MIFKREPAMLLALVNAGLIVAASFGLDLNGQQIAGLNLLTSAVVGWLIRRKVSPV